MAFAIANISRMKTNKRTKTGLVKRSKNFMLFYFLCVATFSVNGLVAFSHYEHFKHCCAQFLIFSNFFFGINKSLSIRP